METNQNKDKKMSTLKSLIEKHGMGDGQRYSAKEWEAHEWIEPFAFSKNGLEFVSNSEDGSFYSHSFEYVSDFNWYLCEEPKKQVVRWKWAEKDPSSNTWYERAWFKSENEITSEEKCHYKKLTYTETSFEE